MSKPYCKIWLEIEKVFGDGTSHPVWGPVDCPIEFPTVMAAKEARDDMLESVGMQKAFNDAINFALEPGADGLQFLRLWREGCWPEIREEWPEFKGEMP